MLMSSQYCENVESWDCEIVRKLWGSCKILRMTYHPSATAAATASVKTSLPRTSWNTNSLMFNVNILLGSIWIGSEHFLTWLEDFPTSSVPKRVAPTKGYISAVTPKKPLTFSIQKDKRETCPYLCWHASLPPSEKEMDFCQYPKQQLYQYIVWMIIDTWTKGSRLGRSSHWPVNAIRASETKPKRWYLGHWSALWFVICGSHWVTWHLIIACLLWGVAQIESGGKCTSWTW